MFSRENIVTSVDPCYMWWSSVAFHVFVFTLSIAQT